MKITKDYENNQHLALMLATELVIAKMGTSYYYRDPTATMLRSAERIMDWVSIGTITDEPEVQD
jgi:hypothetical protein